MKQPIHKIFEETGCVRQEALISYRDNLLSDEDKHDVERHLVDCMLCSDALEGLAIGVSAAYLDEVRDEVRDTITGKPGASTFSSSSRWLVAAAASAVILMSVYTYLQFDNITESNVALQEVPLDEDIPAPQVTQIPEETATTTLSKAEPSDQSGEVSGNMSYETTLPPNQATVKEVVMEEEAEAEVYDDAIPDLTDEAEFISDAVEVNVPASKPESVSGLSLDSNKLLYSASGQGLVSSPAANNITYMNNYKVFSDPGIEKYTQKKTTELKSVSPRYENRDAAKSADAPAVERRELTYDEALELALVEYDNKNYDKALDKLNFIANSKPNDLNVEFYSGMSNYNMSNFSEALKDLEPITKDKNGVFNEEAYFYTALCYYKTGKTQKGINMLNEIANAGGFYANDARSFIEKNR
jgi:hypothetical protein